MANTSNQRGARDRRPPRLPDLLRDAGDSPARALPEGCYYLTYQPNQANEDPRHEFRYLGTLRLERVEQGTLASGDLYVHLNNSRVPKPLPSQGIPVLPRGSYSHYLRVTHVRPRRRRVTLEFERYHYIYQSWVLQGSFTAELSRAEAPPDYPHTGRYWQGQLRDDRGAVRGAFSMGWVSPHLRRATVEIDHVEGVPVPENNGSSTSGWREAFAAVGWQVEAVVNARALPDQPDGVWGKDELHAMMVERRARIRPAGDLDGEWRYHLLCVPRIAGESRGVMYDAGQFDTNGLPREGAALASGWQTPAAWWDPDRRRNPPLFGDEPALYFRTAVHEIGHAMNLEHVSGSRHNGFMTVTSTIAENAGPGAEFPRNIDWSFAPEDRKRLRHWPDQWVRPGGVPYGFGYRHRIANSDAGLEPIDGLALRLHPVPTSGVVPIGAPVRLDVGLENQTPDRSFKIPKLSLKYGHSTVRVMNPSGEEHLVSPIIYHLDDEAMDDQILAPGAFKWHGVTLLHGSDGPLFPMPGVYRILLDVVWQLEGQDVMVAAECPVMITPPATAKHARTALELLSTPDVLQILAIGGEHQTDGVRAIRIALEDATLRPHYAFIEAKRLDQLENTGGLMAADSGLDDPDMLITAAERRHLGSITDRLKALDEESASLTEPLEQITAKADRRIGRLAAEN